MFLTLIYNGDVNFISKVRSGYGPRGHSVQARNLDPYYMIPRQDLTES